MGKKKSKAKGTNKSWLPKCLCGNSNDDNDCKEEIYKPKNKEKIADVEQQTQLTTTPLPVSPDIQLENVLEHKSEDQLDCIKNIEEMGRHNVKESLDTSPHFVQTYYSKHERDDIDDQKDYVVVKIEDTCGEIPYMDDDIEDFYRNKKDKSPGHKSINQTQNVSLTNHLHGHTNSEGRDGEPGNKGSIIQVQNNGTSIKKESDMNQYDTSDNDESVQSANEARHDESVQSANEARHDESVQSAKEGRREENIDKNVSCRPSVEHENDTSENNIHTEVDQEIIEDMTINGEENNVSTKHMDTSMNMIDSYKANIVNDDPSQNNSVGEVSDDSNIEVGNSFTCQNLKTSDVGKSANWSDPEMKMHNSCQDLIASVQIQSISTDDGDGNIANIDDNNSESEFKSEEMGGNEEIKAICTDSKDDSHDTLEIIDSPKEKFNTSSCRENFGQMINETLEKSLEYTTSCEYIHNDLDASDNDEPHVDASRSEGEGAQINASWYDVRGLQVDASDSEVRKHKVDSSDSEVKGQKLVASDSELKREQVDVSGFEFKEQQEDVDVSDSEVNGKHVDTFDSEFKEQHVYVSDSGVDGQHVMGQQVDTFDSEDKEHQVESSDSEVNGHQIDTSESEVKEQQGDPSDSEVNGHQVYTSYSDVNGHQVDTSDSEVNGQQLDATGFEVKDQQDDTEKPLPEFSDNILFYQNKIYSRPAIGYRVEDMHGWKGDYKQLERNHAYIQWLFPIPGSCGMNHQAQPLQEHEAEEIKTSHELKARVLKSFEMMLDFYGMELVDDHVQKNETNWQERYDHLNNSFHNRMRITRIIQSIGELGFEQLQSRWLSFIMVEAMVNRSLYRLGGESMLYFIDAIKEDDERQKFYEKYFRYMQGDFADENENNDMETDQDTSTDLEDDGSVSDGYTTADADGQEDSVDYSSTNEDIDSVKMYHDTTSTINDLNDADIISNSYTSKFSDDEEKNTNFTYDNEGQNRTEPDRTATDDHRCADENDVTPVIEKDENLESHKKFSYEKTFVAKMLDEKTATDNEMGEPIAYNVNVDNNVTNQIDSNMSIDVKIPYESSGIGEAEFEETHMDRRPRPTEHTAILSIKPAFDEDLGGKSFVDKNQTEGQNDTHIIEDSGNVKTLLDVLYTSGNENTETIDTSDNENSGNADTSDNDNSGKEDASDNVNSGNVDTSDNLNSGNVGVSDNEQNWNVDTSDNVNSGSADTSDNVNSGNVDTSDNVNSGNVDTSDNLNSGNVGVSDNEQNWNADTSDNDNSGNADTSDNVNSGSADTSDNDNSGNADPSDNVNSGSADTSDNDNSGNADPSDNVNSGSADTSDNDNSGNADPSDNVNSGSADTSDNDNSGNADPSDNVNSGNVDTSDNLNSGNVGVSDNEQNWNVDTSDNDNSGNADTSDNLNSGNVDTFDNDNSGNADTSDNLNSGNVDTFDNDNSGNADPSDNVNSGSADTSDNDNSGNADPSDNVNSGSADTSDNDNSGNADPSDNVNSGNVDTSDNLNSGNVGVSDNEQNWNADTSDNDNSGNADPSDNLNSGNVDTSDNLNSGNVGVSDNEQNWNVDTSDNENDVYTTVHKSNENVDSTGDKCYTNGETPDNQSR